MMKPIPAAVQTLLKQYASYKAIQAELTSVERRVAKAKVAKQPLHTEAALRDRLQEDLQRLSDAMTFDDPQIWMLYKFYAYQDESQPITTLHDFRVHCSKPGYICTKRYTFLNQSLRDRGFADFDATHLDPTTSLKKLAYDDGLQQLLHDEIFMAQWRTNEYHRVDGVVAKWMNVTTSS